MDKAAENYRRNKNRKRTVPELSDAQKRMLAELMAANASRGEVARRLDIGEIDLDIILGRLGIDSMQSAKEYLRSLKASDEQRKSDAEKRRDDARQKTIEAQRRLDEREGKAEDNTTEQMSSGEVNQIKEQDAERQRNFAKKKPPTRDLTRQYHVPSKHYIGASVRVYEGESNFPSGLETSSFREMLICHGLAFVRDKFDVSNEDIRNEMLRRKISLDFDLLPR